MKGKPRAYFELLRFPAAFTAIADVMMGYLVTHGDLRPTSTFALLVGASSSLYLAGMVLNDVFDVDVDALERPERPIPSGRIQWASASRLGWRLLSGGVCLAWLLSWLTGDWRPGFVGSGLAACVVLYDAVLKRTPIAPIAMGSCRLLNVLFGTSLASRFWHPSELAIAAGIGTYIAGVTWFARTEARTSNRGQLLGGIVVMLLGLSALAFSPMWHGHLRSVRFITEQRSWPLLWIALALVILGRCGTAVVRPEPRTVQIAVRNSLRALIVLDAAVVLGWVGPTWGAAVISLLVPMLLLERWASTT